MQSIVKKSNSKIKKTQIGNVEHLLRNIVLQSFN